MRNGSLHLRCFLGTWSWPQQPHLGHWDLELWAQAAPVFWAPGSCIQHFIGQGTQNLPQLLQLSVAAVELPCLCSQCSHCWICSCCNECHTLPSHHLGIMYGLLTVWSQRLYCGRSPLVRPCAVSLGSAVVHRPTLGFSRSHKHWVTDVAGATTETISLI